MGSKPRAKNNSEMVNDDISEASVNVLSKKDIARKMKQDVVVSVIERYFGGENPKEPKEEDSRYLFILEKFIRHWSYKKQVSRKLMQNEVFDEFMRDYDFNL